MFLIVTSILQCSSPKGDEVHLVLEEYIYIYVYIYIYIIVILYAIVIVIKLIISMKHAMLIKSECIGKEKLYFLACGLMENIRQVRTKVVSTT